MFLFAPHRKSRERARPRPSSRCRDGSGVRMGADAGVHGELARCAALRPRGGDGGAVARDEAVAAGGLRWGGDGGRKACGPTRTWKERQSIFAQVSIQ